MKTTFIIFLFFTGLVLTSCHKQVEVPLQILYAETSIENNSDAQYALYLLSEVEDTIRYYPESIQMQYRLAQAMALNAKGEAVDSLLPPLMEWFDEKGPAKEAARVHHLTALSLLQQSQMEEARKELSRALEYAPSYKPSQFLIAYLCLYTGAYAESLEHFMRIENDEDYSYSVLQGAYALRSSLNTNHSDFAQAMKGDELETARQMLTDMDFCLAYFQEHPDDDRAGIIHRCAMVRDSLLRSRYRYQEKQNQDISAIEPDKEDALQVGSYIPYFILAGIVVIVCAAIMYRRYRKPKAEPQPIFNEIVCRMEQLADNGQQPSAEEWEQLHTYVRDRYPLLLRKLEKQNLSRSEMQMCLLSAVDLRQKQVSTLLNISPQNLRNQRLRLLSRIKGCPCDSVSDFIKWLKEFCG